MRPVLIWLGVALTAALLFGCGGEGSSSPAAGRQEAAEADAKGSGSAQQEAPSEPSAYPRHDGFSTTPITAGQSAQLARSGQVAIPVRVADGGTVSAFGQAEIDGSIVRAADAAARTASGAETVDLTLRLTSAARNALASGGSFPMYVAVRCSCDRTAQQFTIPLGPGG